MNKIKQAVVIMGLALSLPMMAQTTHVKLTHYNPVKSQCDSQPHITSDGSRINMRKLKNKKIRWCAISRDLLFLFPKNKTRRIWIEGYGVYEVRDVTHKRLRHTVDILLHPSDNKKICEQRVKIKILR